MQWKKFTLMSLTILAAAYVGGRMASNSPFPDALAGGAGASDLSSGILTATTAADGTNSNRLVVVDTNAKKILLYNILSNTSKLLAVRPYKYDMKIQDILAAPGNGYEFAKVHQMIMADRTMKKADKESVPKGRELLLTTDGAQLYGNRIILVNPTEKAILVYTISNNQVLLSSARHYDYDSQLFYTNRWPGDGWTRDTIKKQVEAAMKRGE